MKKNAKNNNFDILWHDAFSGQYEIKYNIKGSITNKNIFLLDSTYQSIPTPIEASENTQILCVKSTFNNCVQSGNKAGCIHSTCFGLCIKSSVCTECQTGSYGSFVFHSAQTKEGKFSIENCDVSSCTAYWGTIYSQKGLFTTKSINITNCVAEHIASIVTDTTDSGSFHRFDFMNKNTANQNAIFSLEEYINEMRDCILTNNIMNGDANGVLQTYGTNTVSKVERCLFEGNSGPYIISAVTGSKMTLISCYVQSGAKTSNVEIKNSISKAEVIFLISQLKALGCVVFSQKQSIRPKFVIFLFLLNFI